MYRRKIQGGETMNSAKFIGVMHEHGDTQTSLSSDMGISRNTLNKKIYERDGSAFTQSEMQFIKDRYSLDDNTFLAVFFN